MTDDPKSMDVQAMNRQVIAQFRETGGVGTVGPVNLEHLVLLTTTGRRSGQLRTVPLGYERDAAGNLVLFASNMGAPRDPDWFVNIEANPEVTVEITGSVWTADAIVASGAERDAGYELWVGANPHVAGHQEQAGRPIPIVLVPPAPAG